VRIGLDDPKEWTKKLVDKLRALRLL